MVNKKYTDLDNLPWLESQLMVKSMAELAEELGEKWGVPKANIAGSIRFQSVSILY